MTPYPSSKFSLEKRPLSVIYLLVFNELLENEGYATKNSISHHINHQHQSITIKQFCSILDNTLAATGSSGLGIHYGQQLNMAAAGTVGQLLMSCATLKQAFEKLLTFSSLLSLTMEVAMNRKAGYNHLCIERLYHRKQPTSTQQFLTEAVLSCWIHQARWLTGKALNFKAIEIAYSRPAHWQLYENTFGCEVKFDCDKHRVVIDDDFLQSKIITACEPVRQLKEQHCAASLHRLEKRLPLRERIFTLLCRTSPNTPDMEYIAEKLNLSRSTLYRKLSDANTSYQHVVDDFRCKRAINYLKNTSMTLQEISEVMGFSDASNFRRAFKKWTGFSPSTIRQPAALKA